MLLSVIIVNLNNAKGLKKTLLSLNKLKLKLKFEALIIDGNSSDNSSEIFNSFDFKDNVTFISENDSGIFNAMNKGIKLSKGEWVNFMNSGDCFFEVDNLDQILRTNHNNCIVYGDYIQDNIVRKTKNLDIIKTGIIHACHQSMFFNIGRYRGLIFYNEFFKIYSDYHLIAKLFVKKLDFIKVERVICDFEGGGISNRVSLRKRLEKYLSITINFGLQGLIKSLIWRIKNIH
jgi:glycosyltransferase involved in cell wall biosynthesis